jgi:peptidyl-prolyl cis-trans isomerase A (cyclophilin A)
VEEIMLTANFVLFALACGPSKELLEQKNKLEVQVKDLTNENSRLQKEAETYRKRIEALEKSQEAEKSAQIWGELDIKPEARIRAVIRTTMGDIRCDLWPKVAPVTVLNFVQLAEGTKSWEDPKTGQKQTRPLYSGTVFHRVIPGFMIQGGDPLGNGKGGPGYSFKDETSPDVKFDKPGLLAMANSGPNTNGSQFFVTEGTPDHLNGKHTIFGDCSQDLAVVKKIAGAPRSKSDKPDKDIIIKMIEIQRPK